MTDFGSFVEAVPRERFFPLGGGFQSTFRFRDSSDEVGLCRILRKLFTVFDDPEVSVVDGTLLVEVLVETVEVVLFGVAGYSKVSVSSVIYSGIAPCESKSSESVPLLPLWSSRISPTKSAIF